MPRSFISWEFERWLTALEVECRMFDTAHQSASTSSSTSASTS